MHRAHAIALVALFGTGAAYALWPAEPLPSKPDATLPDFIERTPSERGDMLALTKADASFAPTADLTCIKCNGARALGLTDEEIAQAGEDAELAVWDVLNPVEPWPAIVVTGEPIGDAPYTLGSETLAGVPSSGGGFGGGGFIGGGGPGGGCVVVPGPALPPFASAVPEPSTWTVMLIGFFAVGVALRRREVCCG